MAPKKPAGLSLRQFAALVGVSHTTVAGWIADGKLPVDEHNKVPKAQGMAAVRQMKRQAKQDSPEATIEREHKAALLAAEVRERQAKAEAREQELAARRGELVPLREVREDAAAGIEVFRTRLLAMPSRLALAFEALAARTAGRPSAAEIEATLQDEVADVLGKLHRSRFIQGPAGERVWVCGKCGE